MAKKDLDINEKKNNHQYLTVKEEKQIARHNRTVMKQFERARNRTNIDEEEFTTTMEDPSSVIEFDNLHTYFFTDVGTNKAVNGVSFKVPEGKIVGIVGESGCGKSVTSLSAMQLVQAPIGQIVEGSIRYTTSTGKTYDIAKMPKNEMKRIRGNEISMIFQEPMTSLNPVFKIGEQLDEALSIFEEDLSKSEVKEKSIEMLNLVGIADPEEIYNNYPHELSGGMRQRVMIAMALICDPRLIIADEPTTALDVTIQAQILELLLEVKNKFNGSIMLITHDLGVIASMADYVVVMYAGKVVEAGEIHDIFKNPKHPYTVGLMRSLPGLSKADQAARLYSIPGQVPSAVNLPDHCYFCNRCDFSFDACLEAYPGDYYFNDDHKAACFLYDDKYQDLDLKKPQLPANIASGKEARVARNIPQGRVDLPTDRNVKEEVSHE